MNEMGQMIPRFYFAKGYFVAKEMATRRYY